MSNGRDIGTLNQLFRELSTVVTIPTAREVKQQSELQRIYFAVEGQTLPGEAPLDTALRLIVDGITYNEIREVEHIEAQQKRIQEGWAASCEMEGD